MLLRGLRNILFTILLPCRRSLTAAIQTRVYRARPTNPHQLPPQRGARSMRPHSSIPRRQLVLLCKGAERLFFQIDLAKNLRVRWLQHRQHMRNASADKRARRRVRCRNSRNIQLACRRVHHLALGGTPPIEIDHRIAQYAVKPGDSRIILAETIRPLQRTHIRNLQNIFGKRGVRDAALHKREKPRATVQQRLQCRLRHKNQDVRERQTAPTSLATGTIRAIAFRTARAGTGALRRHRKFLLFRPPFPAVTLIDAQPPKSLHLNSDTRDCTPLLLHCQQFI